MTVARPVGRSRLWHAAAIAAVALAALLGGCAAWLPPPMTAALQRQPVAADARPVELSGVPFFAPTEAAQARHCGPLALASVLVDAGLAGDPVALADAAYLPARGGSLQIELSAAARRSGALAIPLPGTLAALIAELDAGRPVLVLQNLGLGWPDRWLARWHYAVLIGHDRRARTFTLRSGDELRQVLPWETFELTWARAGHWAVAVRAPGDALPVSAEEGATVQAALDFERVATLRTVDPQAARADVLAVWLTVAQRWPLSLVAALGQGEALYALGRLDEAAVVFGWAAQQHGSAVAWNNLAQVEIARRRWDAAQVAVDRAVARSREAEPRWLEAVQATAAELAAQRLR